MDVCWKRILHDDWKVVAAGVDAGESAAVAVQPLDEEIDDLWQLVGVFQFALFCLTESRLWPVSCFEDCISLAEDVAVNMVGLFDWIADSDSD